MDNNAKLRPLYLAKILYERTDEGHYLTTMQLAQILEEEYGIPAHRQTIKTDIELLQQFGMDIQEVKSTQNRYNLISRQFEIAELKLLIDAVQSSKFITQRKSEELITKLLTLTNSQNAAKLRRHIYAAGRVKSENEHGYYIVDAINEAIDTKRKISFYYTDFDIAKQRYVTNGGNPYTVSPYTLIWDGDYYYMRGFCDERQKMRNFRLDRIAEQPKILNQIVVMPPEDYTPADYSKHVFRMYDTEEPVKVQLYCHVSVMKYLIDNFGTDFECEPVDAEHFKATVSVCTSTTFYRWVFGFNGKIKIVEPQNVTMIYKELLQKALDEA